MLDFIVGVGPASERVGEFLDAHPWVCAAMCVLAIVICGYVEGA